MSQPTSASQATPLLSEPQQPGYASIKPKLNVVIPSYQGPSPEQVPYEQAVHDLHSDAGDAGDAGDAEDDVEYGNSASIAYYNNNNNTGTTEETPCCEYCLEQGYSHSSPAYAVEPRRRRRRRQRSRLRSMMRCFNAYMCCHLHLLSIIVLLLMLTLLVRSQLDD